MLAAILSAPVAGCGLFPKSYRVRMTVDVDTPWGRKSGASVFQVTAGNAVAVLPDERKRDWELKGEATAIELPDGQLLVAVLRTRNAKRPDLALMSMATLDPAFRNDVVESAERIASGGGVPGRAQVASSDFPILLLFEDRSDPANAKQVDPVDPGSTLHFPFKIHSVTVEVTSAAVTSGIVKKLKWLPRHHGALLQVPFADYPPAGTPLPAAASLTERDFSQGMVR